MKVSSPASKTIPALLAEQAVRYAVNEALVSAEGRWTYAQLHSDVCKVAKGLYAKGVKAGSHVGLLMGNRAEWVLGFLAVQQLGATAVCLNTWATPREMAYTLSHAEVSCLLAVPIFRNNDYHALMAEVLVGNTFLNQVIWVSDVPVAPLAGVTNSLWSELPAAGDILSDGVLSQAQANIQSKDVAMLLYTSGSTAEPKGILLQHQYWIENAWHIGERLGVRANDRLWLAVSLFWSFGSVNALPNFLSHGACVVLQEHFDADTALALIEQERCTVVYGTPNMFVALRDSPLRNKTDISSLRTGATIGTPEQIQDAVNLGVTQICNIYGLSETYGNCAVIDHREDLDIRLHSVGQPLPGVTVRIVDIDSAEDLPAGKVGEIRVKGPLFKAYFKEPEKTADCFDAQGFFCTGDLGECDAAGRLYYKGRLKEMVKSGGINIAPIEVEEVLMRHPLVHSAYVIGIPDLQLDEVMVAFIVAEAGQTLSAQALKAFCKQEMAAYKVPAQFKFVQESDLPLTSTRKLQKIRLKELL